MSLSLSAVASGFAAALNAWAAIESVPLPVYDRDALPQTPPARYVVIDATTTGYGWDPTLLRAEQSGPVAVQATAVARRRDNALWCLDQVRHFASRIEPTDVALPAGTRAICVWSAGPPSTPIEEGDLITATETYYLHLEAQ